MKAMKTKGLILPKVVAVWSTGDERVARIEVDKLRRTAIGDIVNRTDDYDFKEGRMLSVVGRDPVKVTSVDMPFLTVRSVMISPIDVRVGDYLKILTWGEL